MKHAIMRIVRTTIIVALFIIGGQAAAQESKAAAEAEAATVTVAKKEPYGAYLVDAAGKSLYLFKADIQGEKSTCYGACAGVWPPLLTQGKPQVSGKADKALLGTIERKDGSMQVTYNGWPLYYFLKDIEPGYAKGQGVKGFGANWYLVTPAGEPVHVEEHEEEEY